MNFDFHYEISDNITWNKEIELRVNRQRREEKEYFEKYGKTLDKSKIPQGSYCNNENMCCPYCVSDMCLLFGACMESKIGYYGFSFQKRKKRCIEKYPKGKLVAQIEFELEGGAE